MHLPYPSRLALVLLAIPATSTTRSTPARHALQAGASRITAVAHHTSGVVICTQQGGEGAGRVRVKSFLWVEAKLKGIRNRDWSQPVLK